MIEPENLYQNVKKQICRMIYQDIYRDGELIPPERTLSKELGVSRVTVRKALQLLEEEHIIERIQGSGTRVALQYGARAGTMDIITLVAPTQNAFFSRFLDAFQNAAEEMDSLVLLKQKPGTISLEKCLYQIYEKNLRNVVLWMEDMELRQESLQKLRGLGMDIVLFDTSYQSVYADAVCLDNQDAVKQLLGVLTEAGCKRPGFVGWDEMGVSSVRLRDQTFRHLVPDAPVCRVPWIYHNHLEKLHLQKVDAYLDELKDCDGILYGVGELGMHFEQRAKELGMRHTAVMIDDLPGADALGISSLEQDFQRMSETIFGCLKRQNQEGSAWSAGVYKVRGHLQKTGERRDAGNGN